MIVMRRNVLAAIFLLLFVLVVRGEDKVFKVLAIGNSFSVDAVEQNLYELAAAQGKDLMIGNAYIGGCSINAHLQYLKTGAPNYSYRKGINGKFEEYASQRLADIIKNEDWDLITLQQSSPQSGQLDKYVNMNELKDGVKSIAKNPNVRFAFHMTWAYQQNSTHSAFVNYESNQKVMYRSICKAVNSATRNAGIKDIIPCGRAIQIAREMVGDTLTRDGYHLALKMGRYVAACTWCEYLTGKSVEGNPYRPSGMSEETARKAQAAAHKAMRHLRRALRQCETE